MIIDFENIDVFDEYFCIRTKEGTHEYIIRDDSHEMSCDGAFDFLACFPLGDLDQMRAIFKCGKCNIFFEDIYNYSGFETYEEAGMENAYNEL